MFDFNNIILVLEQSGELFICVISVFFVMIVVYINDELQCFDEQFFVELVELVNDIYLNGELFVWVDVVWQCCEFLGLDSEFICLVEVIY